jgi:hypothetical protein
MYNHIMLSQRPKWQVIYYTDANDKSDVFDFINDRKDREKAKILALLTILEEQGPQLPRPYADILSDGIHELRVKLSGDQVRILYFFCYQEFIVMTNWFTKNTDKVPIREIEKAKKLRNDFLKRNNEKSLRSATNDNT